MRIYRACSGTAKTMTPRPDRDTQGDERGLSAFDQPELVPGEPGEQIKVQIIETEKLAGPLSVIPHANGHMSIVPVTDDGEIDDAALTAWAATRDAAQPGELTSNVLAAVVGQQKVLKKEGP